MPTRPILACKVDDIRGQLFVQFATQKKPEVTIIAKYPLLATPKIDGIRALRLQDTLLSRSFKEIPNTYVRTYLTTNTPPGLDGELVVLDAGFHETQSGIMSESGIPDFRYLVFDYCPDGLEDVGYEKRLGLLGALYSPTVAVAEVSIVPSTLVHDPSHLTQYEETCLTQGYEGVCLRSPNSPYKSGRSTLREHFLLKLKRFEDAEAKVVGFQELERNGNEATVSELGLLKRSHKAEGRTSGQTLGALLVEDCTTNTRFGIGTGFTSAQRQEFWNNQHALLGRLVSYKHQPFGRKDAPRIPVFKGFRDVIDL